ncbi:NYN domain-containing protein [Microcoleus sp. FACHB-53]|jgi:uncharacterized LabA/DUF88 family protein|nr:NYN domain-containing protein [Microcoleus sp. FACHB-53]
MANFVYVDNSNLWIEGKRISAVKKGLAPDIRIASKDKIVDDLWRINLERLYQLTVGKSGHGYFYGSRTSGNGSVLENAEKVGFIPVTYNRSFVNKEKEVDQSIACDVVEHSYELMQSDDRVIILSGDRDLVPAINKLIKRRFKVEVLFWNHAASNKLKQAASNFVPLDRWLNYLALN